MSTPSTSRRRSQSRSKTLPAVPTGEESEAALTRSLTTSASHAGDKQNRGSRGKSRKEVGEELEDREEHSDHAGPSLSDRPEEGSAPHTLTPPRKRSTSAQNSNRDYFVYAEPTSAPTIHLRDPHHKSRTLPNSSTLLATSPDTRTRSQSLGEGSSYTRVRVDDSAFWSAEAGGRGATTQDSPEEGKNIKDIDTLPTIPGSSASSDNNTQSPPSVPDKDSTDSQSEPTISQAIWLQPRHHDPETPKPLSESYTIPHQDRRQSATGKLPAPIAASPNPLSPRSSVKATSLTRAPESTTQEPSQKEAATESANESMRATNPDPPMPSKTPPPLGGTSTTPREEKTEEHEGELDDEGLPSTVTRYMNMLLALDKIPRIHNLSASFFTWILLAGFVLFPGTFTSLRNSGINGASGGVTEQVAKSLLNAVDHLSLFVIAFLCCGIGATGMSYLWWRWRGNYIWLVNKIFLPGLMNSFAGVISTIASIYGAQHGQFSLTSKVTLGVTCSTTVVCGVLAMYYMLWNIRRVKAEHDRIIGKQKAGKHGEGLIQTIRRKANEGGSRSLV